MTMYETMRRHLGHGVDKAIRWRPSWVINALDNLERNVLENGILMNQEKGSTALLKEVMKLTLARSYQNTHQYLCETG